MEDIKNMSTLKSLIPLKVKRSIKNYAGKIFGFDDLRRQEILARQREEEAIPKFDLKEIHIANLKVVLDRKSLLERIPKNGVCAEIGVDKGEFSEEILKIVQPAKLHLIDAWGDAKRYSDDLKISVQNKFKKEIEKKIVEINIGLSTDVLKTFPDSYFDWVYLDTAHTYEITAAELAILKSKVKPSGIISGHDYIIGNWVGGLRYGVVEAVHELCVKDNWELIYLTTETHQGKSFAVKKLS